MTLTSLLLLGAGVAAVTRLSTFRRTPAIGPSWGIPNVQQAQIDRLHHAAALYHTGRGHDARAILSHRDTDWPLITLAARHSSDPNARRIATILGDRTVGAFINELHRSATNDRDEALTVLQNALTDYTGPTSGR